MRLICQNRLVMSSLRIRAPASISVYMQQPTLSHIPAAPSHKYRPTPSAIHPPPGSHIPATPTHLYM